MATKNYLTHTERYRIDKEYREYWKKYMREKYHTDQEYHQRTLLLSKIRYNDDIEYRKATKHRSIERWHKLQSERKSKRPQ